MRHTDDFWPPDNGQSLRTKKLFGNDQIYNMYNLQGQLVHISSPEGATHYIYLGKQQIAKLSPNAEYKDKSGYTGHLEDKDIDLTYMQQRYYDPVLGRFHSNDPVGFTPSNPMMFNRYAYANNNPYKFTDPDGRNPFIVHGDSDNATLTRESFKEGGDMFTKGVNLSLNMMQEVSKNVIGLIAGPEALAASVAIGALSYTDTGSLSDLGGVAGGEVAGGIMDQADMAKGNGKLGIAVEAGTAVAKFAAGLAAGEGVKKLEENKKENNEKSTASSEKDEKKKDK